MAITIRRSSPNDRYLELGGGANPLVHPECMGGKDVNVDSRTCFTEDKKQTTDIPHDLNVTPLPIQSDEFDGLICHFALEHVSYNNVPALIKEMLRVIKPGAKALVVVPNTEVQLKWIQEHGEGWDNKDSFVASSDLLYGTLDYPENSHRAYFSPTIATKLFIEAGFKDVLIQPYGERSTDMVIQATKPVQEGTINLVGGTKVEEKLMPPMAPGSLGIPNIQETQFRSKEREKVYSREEMFDKVYFNGGAKVGGYAATGYTDFPCHEVTFQHILARKPESVLELGCARGYVLKRIQDVGIPALGMEISKHCYMTRAAELIIQHDICKTPWPVSGKEVNGQQYDLCFSIAVLEHIPEEFLPAICVEMERTCKRGLHGIDFGQNDSGFDKTHTTLRPKEWWQARLPRGHEVIDKEELERGNFPEHVLKRDDKDIKLNIGCHTMMFHRGWTNIDILDMGPFAQANAYHFMQRDVKQGIQFPTGSVHLIYLCHTLEHFTYSEAISLLRECRRLIRPEDGAMRILVPDAAYLVCLYGGGEEIEVDTWNKPYELKEFDEINDGCSSSLTKISKLWSLLVPGHQAGYDAETLEWVLKESGWIPKKSAFRQSEVEGGKQMVRECVESFPCLSLTYDCIPAK